jgi:hypothetical protein
VTTCCIDACMRMRRRLAESCFVDKDRTFVLR